jgi:RNA-dependent RNA polymerase
MAEINNDKIVPLPCVVEELIAKICREQNRRPLETNTRLTLASLGEEVALNILWRISGQEIRKSFDGFVLHLAKQFSPNINASSSSPNIHSSLSQSPQQPQNRSPITTTRLLMNSQSNLLFFFFSFRNSNHHCLENFFVCEGQRCNSGSGLIFFFVFPSVGAII